MEAIKLKVGDWQHFQKLDYEQFLFKCRGCHEYGHFQRNCSKIPIIEKAGDEGWQQAQKGKAKKKAPRSKNIVPTQAKNSGNKEKENNFSILARETDDEIADPSKDSQVEETRGN